MSTPAISADSKVAMVLMKSEEADATIDVLQVDQPDVKIVDRGPTGTWNTLVRSASTWPACRRRWAARTSPSANGW